MPTVLVLLQTIPIAFTALFPVINPVGTAIILLSMTEGADASTRRALARKIAFNTAVLLAILLLGGSYLLAFFGISVPIVQTAGGVVLASMGWQLLNQKENLPTSGNDTAATEDPQAYFQRTFYPFTFPLTVGPGSVAVILTLSAHTTHGSLETTALHQAGALIGILGNAIVVYFCFAYSTRLVARLGASGTTVLMRLIAFIVVCIGANISWSGISTLIWNTPHG